MRLLRRIVICSFTLLLGLVLLAGGLIFSISEARLRKTYQVDVATLTIPSDAASIARGHDLTTAVVGCVGCHADNLGGKLFADAPPFLLNAPNLTSGQGGVGNTYSDADWVRAVRHGVRLDDRALLFMPSKAYSGLSDADLAAIIAYIKSVPPVDNELDPSQLRPLGRVLLVAGQYELPAETIDHKAAIPAVPVAGRTAAYGGYLVRVGACADCHGANLSGAPFDEPGVPPAANITPGGLVGIWSEEEFITAMRTGQRPDGSTIHPAMPWEILARQSDDELGAMYRYLQSLPALAYHTPEP